MALIRKGPANECFATGPFGRRRTIIAIYYFAASLCLMKAVTMSFCASAIALLAVVM
jgi:hypothetical protein